jgi:hypothetical protein
MVRIIAYEERLNKESQPFVALILQGDLVMVQSQETGRYYATAKKCSITSTFSEEEAKALVGKELPGRISKVACPEFEYTIEETGETITLNHRWEYLPDGEPTPLRVVSNNMAA